MGEMEISPVDVFVGTDPLLAPGPLALGILGTTASSPSFDGPVAVSMVFLAIAFGSNLPAYGAGETSSGCETGADDSAGVGADFLSI